VFSRYRKKGDGYASLVWPEQADRTWVTALLEGITLCRNLINTPASDMGPEELATAGTLIAERHGATSSILVGEQLLEHNYPMVHAVGRASSRAPRLFDLRWGSLQHPKLTLVGKGVCFDSGGLDIKPAADMKLMKKDMGGAALVLGVAHVLMSLKLPVRLRVLVPAVENSVSGNAMRPLDVLPSRKGLTVEIGNTDAEGRLILADALTEACTESPDLLIDAATLTGAARVALGAALPALFSTDDAAAEALLATGRSTGDPLWRLPLHEPYRKSLDSKVADLNNISSDSYGGAITAALFLREFVAKKQSWMHIDTMGWNLESRPGRPYGGEALGLRALVDMLVARYGR
jgi:leucyl aminopeptidase